MRNCHWEIEFGQFNIIKSLMNTTVLRAWPFVVLLVGQSKRRSAIINNTTMFYYYEHTSHMFHKREWCNIANLDLVLSLIA